MPTPALDNAPELDPHLLPILDAFRQLDAGRSWNMGVPLPMQLSEIKAYAEMFGYKGEELEELIRHMRAMDTQYLEHAAKKREEESKRKGKK